MKKVKEDSSSVYSQTHKKGEVIFKEGQKGDCAYLIEKGQVEIFVENKDERTPIALLGPGEIFGEMAIIDNSKREASAVANSNCILSVVSKVQLSERIDESDPIVRLLITMLLDRIRDSLKMSKTPTKNKTGKLALKVKKTKHSDITDVNLNVGVIEKIRFEKDLHAALEQDQFMLHFQPVINIDNQEIVGFEALTRWNSPEHGLVRPDLFMGIAEETSLIIPLGHWITRTAIEEFSRLKKELKAAGKPTKLFCSINVSGRQFADPEFFDILQKACWAGKIRPQEIKLEITERVLVTGQFVFDWIKKCTDIGYSVALDDFGTGYSSLSYLAQIDANNIKIDKSFVQAMEEDQKTYVIVESVINMAKGLGKTIIAEGIETESQYKILKKMGCEYAQGYLFSRPQKIDDIIEIMTAEEPFKKVA